MSDAAGQLSNRVQLLRLPELLFELETIGDVADGRRQQLPGLVDGNQGDLDAELRAVGANRRHLDSLGDGAVGLALDIPHEIPIVCLAQRLRHDDVCRIEADDVLAPAAEHGFGGGVEFEDLAVGAKDDHTVERRFEDGAMPRLAVPQRLLGHLAFELGGHPRGDDLQDGFGLRGLHDRSGMQQRNQAKWLSAGPEQRHAHVAVDAHVHEPLIGRKRALNLRDMVSERPGDDALARCAAQVVGEIVKEHAFVRGGDRPASGQIRMGPP